jgi:glycosyltransferase involved in cell wall biosynthesis
LTRVSVVIPTHRRPMLLAAAIRSVLAQSFQDFEIVVVDDASRDNTEDVVRAFGDPRIRYIAHRTNWRVGAARNTGVLNSRAPLIAFLDDDDEWLPEKLERQIALLDRCAPVTGIVYTGFQKIERSSGEVLSTVTPSKEGHILHELCLVNCVGTASTVLLRRECFDEVGLFDEGIDFGEEYDMWIRIARSFDFRYIAEPLVRYSVHDNRLSRSYGTIVRGLEAQLRKYANFFSIYPDGVSRRYLTLGSMYCRMGQVGRGRAAFRRAIRARPTNVKNYLYWGLSLFGTKIFQMVREPVPRTL